MSLNKGKFCYSAEMERRGLPGRGTSVNTLVWEAQAGLVSKGRVNGTPKKE